MALLAGQTHGGAGSTQFCSQRMEVPWYFCPIQPSCCCPPPQQLQLLHLGGKFSVWAPGGQEAAGHGSGWSCLCGWGSCSALLDQESSGQPCPGTWRAVTGVNVWHRNHFSVFRGADWSSSCWMPTLRCTAVMPIHGRIPASKISSLPYKKQIFWLKCLLLCFSSFCCLTPQLTAPIIHIPEFLWLFSHPCNRRVARAVFSTNSLLKNGKGRLIISSCWQAQ